MKKPNATKPVIIPFDALVAPPVKQEDALRVGDQMRFSVVLLERLWEDESTDGTAIVEVLEIRQEPDGTKTLVMQRPSYVRRAES